MKGETPWSRSRRLAVIILFGAQALYAASLPFWFIDTMTRYANEMNARFGAPPPDATAGQSDAIATAMFGVFVVLAVAVAAGAILAAFLRWRWAYYAVIVLLGLEAVEALSSAAGALLPSLLTAAPPPLPVLVPAVVTVLGTSGLCVWMILGLVKRSVTSAPASAQ